MVLNVPSPMFVMVLVKRDFLMVILIVLCPSQHYLSPICVVASRSAVNALYGACVRLLGPSGSAADDRVDAPGMCMCVRVCTHV